MHLNIILATNYEHYRVSFLEDFFDINVVDVARVKSLFTERTWFLYDTSKYLMTAISPMVSDEDVIVQQFVLNRLAVRLGW